MELNFIKKLKLRISSLILRQFNPEFHASLESKALSGLPHVWPLLSNNGLSLPVLALNFLHVTSCSCPPMIGILSFPENSFIKRAQSEQKDEMMI